MRFSYLNMSDSGMPIPWPLIKSTAIKHGGISGDYSVVFENSS